MRIRGVSEDGEDLTKLLPTLEAKFASVGLTLKKDDQTFKSTYEIFEDLASVWGRLSDFQQAEFVELVAGKHQGNIAASMVANWKDAQASLEAGLNSFGSATRENEVYLQSMQGKLAQFKNAANAFWSDSINSDFLKSLIDSGTALIKVLDNLGTTMLLLTGIFLTFKHKAIANFVIGMATATKGLFAFRTAATGATVAMKGLQLAFGWIGIATALGTSLYALFSKTKESADEATESYNTLKESITDTSYNVSQLESLNEEYKSGNKTQEELLEIREKMKEIMPSIISHYDEEGKAVYKTGQEIDGLIQKEKDLLSAKQNSLSMMASEILKEPTQNIVDAKIEIDKSQLEHQYAEASKAATDYVSNFLKDNKITVDQIFDLKDLSKLDKFQSDIEKIFADRGFGQYDANKFFAALNQSDADFTKFIELINSNFAKVDEAISANKAKIDEAKMKFVSSFGDINQDLMNSLSNNDQNLKNILDKVAQEYVNSVDITKDNKDSIISNYRKLSKDIANAITKDNLNLSKMFSTGDFTNLSNTLSPLEKQFPQLESVITSFSNSVKESSRATGELANNVLTLKSQLDNVAKSKTNIQLLNKAQKELKDTNHVSIDTMIDLIEIYDDYINVSNLSKEQILEYIEVKKQEEIAVVGVEKAKAKAFIDTARAGLLAMKAANSVSIVPIPEATFLLAEEAINQLENRLGLLDAATQDLIYTSEENNREQEKSNDTYSETNEILTETQKRLRAIQTELDKLNNKRSKIRKGSAEYRKSLMEEISLLKEQKKLYEDGIKNPEKLVSTKVTTTSKSASASGYTGTVTSSSPTNVSGNYASIINHYASQYGVDPKLIAAIIQTESGFNSNAVSSAGAQGLMQLMPKTAKGLGVKNSFDPEQNIKGGTSHFARLVKLYEGDIELALYAYNAGEGNVNKWRKNGQINNIPFKETRNYAPKVLANFNAMGGAVTATTTSSSSTVPPVSSSSTAKNKITLPSKSELEEAKNNAINTVSTLESTIYNKVIDFINDVVVESNNKIEKFENSINRSENKQSKYSETSKEWRKEEMSQISYLTKQQDELHNQNERLKQLVKEKQITSGEFDKLMEQNSLKWLDIQEQKQKKTFDLFSSSLNEIDEQIASYGDKIAFSNAKLASMAEGTEKYNKELLNQIPLLKEQQKLASKEADLIREQLKKEKLTIAQKKELSERLNQLSTNWWDYQAAIKDVNETIIRERESAADKIIDNYKRMLEKEKELALKAYQEQTDAENKRHEQRVNNLNEELKLFEDVIAAQLESLDRQYSEDDYNTELNSKLKEQQKIQDDINKLALDDSIEGKARKKELEEQLTAKEDEIFKFRQDRERELRKQNLSDQLEAKRDQLEQEKKAEDNSHEHNLDNIEKEKKAKEQFYNDILDNEKYFYDMKQNLMSEDASIVEGQLNQIKGRYSEFFDFLKQQAFETSQAFENLNYGFTNDYDNIGKFPPSSSGSNSDEQKNAAWQQYLSNKQQAENMTREVIQMQRDKKPDTKAIKNKQDQITSLRSQNDAYRAQYGFPDGSYDQIKNIVMSAKTGGMTPSWGSEGKFLLAHEKELILNKVDTSNLIKAVDITRGIVNKIKDFNHTLFNNQRSGQLATDTGNVYLDIHIDKLIGDEQGANNFFGIIQNRLKNRKF
ncbi:transglycosylase SLT domain-containing protein [Paenibacillus sp. ISL-20]|uniref:transglycosylase SLT domain-containing protein n=1 Tax=Paenibacillus sp. ISL-20 TaxID=2819163 RepID=UPI001BECB0B7|nr:transglycosylase SLT domain-containing protein [Paenibacillus sp. ISL-20]MBT2759836.1 transglycosylase SLT domain-containing protein [Paenibacillus sp. ISL-20]